jgi:NAD(P)H-dependent flavin oxidoreductase YrpB (nitropropane dioxygenase family)
MRLHPTLQQLGMTSPIFQAPIGGVASPELAAAVSEVGGLGHLACTWRTPEQLDALFGRMADLTRRSYGANFVLDFPIDDKLGVALVHEVKAVSFFWGDGGRYVARVKAAGAVAIQVVGSICEAKRAAEAGFDLIVAQGFEAGGHVSGETGLMALLPQVVDAVSPLPVLAAGGIADCRGVAAALALGAVGVWIGTRFLAADEASIHPSYRERVLVSDGDDTVYAKLFDIGWPNAPARSLVNSTVAGWRAAGGPQPPHRPGESEVVAYRAGGTAVPRYHFSAPTPEITGTAEAMALYAGCAVGLVRSRAPAAQIVAELAAGAGGSC